jgi:hypothetical protein
LHGIFQCGVGYETMNEKIAELARRIAQAAHLNGAKQAVVATDPTAATGKTTVTPASDFHWTASFLGSEKSIPAPVASVWGRAKQTRLQANTAALAHLPLSVQIAAMVGREIWAARQVAPGKAMQIVSGSKLIAVLSTSSPTVAVRTDVLPEDVAFMTALVRPGLAGGTPAGFIQHDLWKLLWQYGIHDATALLEMPAEVAWRPLQLRRLPQVSPYLLQPRHATILRHLLDGDQTFEQLAQLTGEIPELLCHDVTALMLTRSVRTA